MKFASSGESYKAKRDSMGAKEVHGFDSFEGLTAFSEHDPHDDDAAYMTTGQFRGDPQGAATAH